MTEGAAERSVTINAKEAALSDLRDFAKMSNRRDELVSTARRTGASYDEIVETSELSRGTVTSILTRAGLVGRSSSLKETPMTSATTSTPGMVAQFFPHHPHFVSVTQQGSGSEYRFRAFTGDEPQPEFDGQHPYLPEAERPVDYDYETRVQEWDERAQEMDAALRLWQTARYRREITPLVAAALKARPPVDQALAALQAAWDALDNALVWPVAVKQVLEAQDKARAAMERWVDDYAYPLAKAEGSQPYYIREHVANWHAIATDLNGGKHVKWDTGHYYAGDRHCSADYSDNPMDELDQTIRKQRDALADIAKYNKSEPTT